MNKFDTNGWGEFKIGDIFDIQTGSLLNSKELKNGDIKRISAKNENNGIIGSYDTEFIKEARHYENFISVNFFGDTFYHPYKASVEMKVHILKLKNKVFTQSSGIFIASILKRYFSDKFGYGNQLSSSKLKNENFKISLPITQNGEIDFEFMETTIKNTKSKMQNILNTYKSLIERERERVKFGIWILVQITLYFRKNAVLFKVALCK
ncbi:MAG: restriction endonuclease subunit S [Cardiobacteriaceae bacterium]|nr:restriction endonuclease subunit S [Cardiobacteriaceae bacterium]